MPDQARAQRRFMDASDEELRYTRQFHVAETVPDAFSSWAVTELSGPWKCASKNLSLGIARSDRGSITVLGEALDPERPRDSNAAVAERLMADYSTAPPGQGFTDLEVAMDGLGGRWVLILDLDGETRAYPDAFGSRGLVFVSGEGGAMCVASQPQLIAAARGDRPGGIAAGLGLKNGSSWPVTLTPQENVRRVLPNHYVDVRRGESRRFWPRAEAPVSHGLDTAAHLMASYYQQLLVAAAQRWRLQIALTAGYDSRMAVTAAATAGIQNLQTFTQARRKPRSREWLIAGQVAHVLGLPHQVVNVRDVPEPMRIKRIMEQNGGFANLSGVAFGLNVEPDEMLLLSHCDEALRRVELPYESAADIQKYSGGGFSKRFGDRAGPALQELDRWLEEAPQDSWFNIADLYTWEITWGCFLPNKYGGIDTVAPLMAPQNCRDYQMVGMVLAEELRGPPNKLFRRMFEILAPELLEIEFNKGANEI